MSDFLVIGAGIAGASAAYELLKRGSVTVLEREDAPGRHSTGRSAAMFIGTYGNAAIRALTRASAGHYRAPPEGFAEYPLLRPRGVLMIARRDQLDALDAFEAEVTVPGSRVERLRSEAAAGLVPILRPGAVAAGVVEHDAMEIDVDALHQGYLRGIRKGGGKVAVNAGAAAIARTGGVWTVETRAGAFSAPVLVNAAGAWCDEIAELAGVRPVGLAPKRRTAIIIDAPEDHDTGNWPVAADIGERYYFKPEAGALLVSPADETPMPPCDAQPDEFDIAAAVDRFETATTITVRRIVRKWSGLRSFVADRTLVIGFDDEADGFFWLAGQGGYGIQTGPAAAQAAAGLIADGALPGHIADAGLTEDDLSPARPALERVAFQA